MKQNNKKIKVLSLFDGISCGQVALKQLGYNVEYYASEIDKYAIAITQKNHPETKQLGDVKNINGERLLYNGVTEIDLLIGGSPCQDLSIAKKNRQGLAGKRSGLFYEYLRILKEIKPKYFILENVNSMPKEARDEITKEIGVLPIMINASLVSAQNRKRLFWTNIPNIYLPEDRNIFLKDILESGDTEYLKSYCITATYQKKNTQNFKKGDGQMIRIGNIGSDAQAQRVYDIKGKSATLSAGGGGQGGKTGLYLIQRPRGKNKGGVHTEKSPTLTSNSFEHNNYVVEPVALRNRGNGKKPEYNNTGKANAMTTVQTDSMVAYIPEATKKGYAIAKEGDSIDLSYPTSNTRRGRVGNKAKNLMTSQNIGVFTQGVIRKLTPIECERLQCLPDNYTGGVSDSQRYKACGNAFNVEVVKHILTFAKFK